jgi:hypothetical protein
MSTESPTWVKKVYKVRVSKGGRDSLYPYIRFPLELADKYSLNQECIVEVIDRQDLGGILIKKSS